MDVKAGGCGGPWPISGGGAGGNAPSRRYVICGSNGAPGVAMSESEYALYCKLMAIESVLLELRDRLPPLSPKDPLPQEQGD